MVLSLIKNKRGMNMNDKVAIKQYKPNAHIKMYANDIYMKKIKAKAKQEGLTLSSYLFGLVKKDLKRGGA